MKTCQRCQKTNCRFHGQYCIQCRNQRRWDNNRRRAIDAYEGPVCACCRKQLAYKDCQIDHVHGGGNKHCRQFTTNLTSWLIQQKFPPGFQILCKACNALKGQGDRCPCQDEIRRKAPVTFTHLQEDGTIPVVYL